MSNSKKKEMILRVRKEDIDFDKMDKLIDYFGSQTHLAIKLGITKQNVNSWCNGRANIPVHHLHKIEKISGGKFKIKFLLKRKVKDGKADFS